MDKVKAKELEASLIEEEIGGAKVIRLKNFGKSAAVFEAYKENEVVALKIFDDELIEKYGDTTQLKRIERELDLVGNHHPNIVKILGGGYDEISRNHYILMEYLDAPNLKQSLNKIPFSNIGALISQLALAGQFLEGLGLVHRDIKPENIVVLDDFSRLVLLDFGVLRPVGEPGITDDSGVQAFVGTLQYSSPEFLLREEEDTIEGWRALTFYQIGGVLHDLIMRTELFGDKTQPYARLVNAVQHDNPQIHNPSVPSYLVEAARIALSKNPKVRVDMLTWTSFHFPQPVDNQISAAKDRVTKRAILRLEPSKLHENQVTNSSELVNSVVNLIKVKSRAIRNSDTVSLPPVTVTRNNDHMRLCFGPSENHNLNNKLTIELKIDILDTNVGAIQLSALAFYGDGSTPAHSSGIVLYKGTLATNDISKALENCIYVSVDKAQQTTDSTDNKVLCLNELEAIH